MAVERKECSACGQSHTKANFTNTQWLARLQRHCRGCATGVGDGGGGGTPAPPSEASRGRPYAGMSRAPLWRCGACERALGGGGGLVWHSLENRAALAPFERKHGFRWASVPEDGDCFYSAIIHCLRHRGGGGGGGGGGRDGPPPTVREMRCWVADTLGVAQLEVG